MNDVWKREPVRTLIAAFEARLGPVIDVTAQSRSWASATFVGKRYSLSFVTADISAVVGFSDAIGETDLPLPRAFVADASVTSTMPMEGIGTRVTVEVLVIEDP